MNSATFKFILRDLSTREDGKKSIYLQCYINGIKKYYSLKYIIDSAHWNEDKQQVTKDCPHYIDINQKIELYLSTVKSFVRQADALNEKVSLSLLDEALRTGQYDRKNFIDFFKKEIELSRPSKRPSTIKKYESILSTLLKFRKQLSFNDINIEFWRKYESYLYGLGNKPNTVQKVYKTLKAILNRAIDAKLINENPFSGIKVKGEVTQLKYLKQDELDLLYEYYLKDQTIDSHKKALRSFLFSCFTGCRYSDVYRLKQKNIVRERGELYLMFTMYKVNKPLKLLINDQALSLLPSDLSNSPEMPIFGVKVFTNQYENRILKDISAELKINKPIGFHWGRHTFGTLSIANDIDIYLLKDLMGHSSVKETEKYAKVIGKDADAAMRKWNKPKEQTRKQSTIRIMPIDDEFFIV